MRLCLTIFALLIGAASVAQPERDKVTALRMAFISKRLDLTATESEKFWPVYNEYQDKLKVLKRNLRNSYRTRMDRLGDQEAEELYQLEIVTRQAETDLYKDYAARMRGAIGTRKLARLHMAEEEFRKELINTIKEKSD